MTVKGQTTADVGYFQTESPTDFTNRVGPSFKRSFSGLKGIGGLVVFFFFGRPTTKTWHLIFP